MWRSGRITSFGPRSSLASAWTSRDRTHRDRPPAAGLNLIVARRSVYSTDFRLPSTINSPATPISRYRARIFCRCRWDRSSGRGDCDRGRGSSRRHAAVMYSVAVLFVIPAVSVEAIGFQSVDAVAQLGRHLFLDLRKYVVEALVLENVLVRIRAERFFDI